MDSRLLFLLILLPLAGGIVNACVGCRLPRRLVPLLAIGSVLGSFILSISLISSFSLLLSSATVLVDFTILDNPSLLLSSPNLSFVHCISLWSLWKQSSQLSSVVKAISFIHSSFFTFNNSL